MSHKESSGILDVAIADTRDGVNAVALLDGDYRSRRLSQLLLVIVVLVLLFFAWALIAQVDELAKARGEVQPIERVQVIQSKEGGLLENLLVQPGDFVRQGQPIARFVATEIIKDSTQIAVRRDSLKIDLERWGAIAEKREPDFSGFVDRPRLVEAARALYVEQVMLNQAAIAARQQALNEQAAALQGVKNQLPMAERAWRLAEDVARRYGEGVARDVIPKVRLAEAQEHAADASRNYTQLQSRAAELESSLGQARSELGRVQQEVLQQARSKRSELLEQIQELNAEATSLTARRGLTEVVAPVTGYIKQIPDNRVGAVIAPGGTVAEIVPSEGGVMVEAMVSPRDIGFVHVGQDAIVKVDAFDYSRFGSVRGKVKRISPSAFRQESNGMTFYKAEILLEKPYVGQDKRHVLIPGMTSEVDIVTGRKSVFQYLAKPVFLSADTAFHER